MIKIQKSWEVQINKLPIYGGEKQLSMVKLVVVYLCEFATTKDNFLSIPDVTTWNSSHPCMYHTLTIVRGYTTRAVRITIAHEVKKTINEKVWWSCCYNLHCKFMLFLTHHETVPGWRSGSKSGDSNKLSWEIISTWQHLSRWVAMGIIPE